MWTNPFNGRFTWFNRKINGNFFFAFSKDVFFMSAEIQSYPGEKRPKSQDENCTITHCMSQGTYSGDNQ